MLLSLAAQHRRRLLLLAATSLRRPVATCLTMTTSSSASSSLSLSSVLARRQLTPPPLLPSPQRQQQQPIRWGGHGGPRRMLIQASRHQWDHFWDDVHYYALLGIIPCGLLALCLYVFVGPAELTELPEDYEPQEYEYHRHPLTRFLAWFKTTCVLSDQEAYERNIAYLNEEYVRMETRKEFRQIKQQEGLLGDYRGYYFVPVNPRPVSQHHAHRQIEDMAGDLPHGFQSEDPRELPTDIGAPRHQY